MFLSNKKILKRREPPHQKTNQPMITNAKKYT